MPERLSIPPIPQAFERPIRVWQRLDGGRSVGGFGLGPISWQDIHAFCQVTGERLSEGDLEAIRLIDACYFESQAAAEERRSKARVAER